MLDGSRARVTQVSAASWPAAATAGDLLRALGIAVGTAPDTGAALSAGGIVVRAEPSDAASDWAMSGAMALTGRPDGPPLHTTGQPATLARGAALAFELLTAAFGQRVRVDGRELLSERAALLNLRRRGDVSAGGAARLLRAADGWFALNLPRDDDLTLLPALVEDSVGSDPWGAVSGWAGGLPVTAVVDRAALLGLAAGALASAAPPRTPWTLTRLAGQPRAGRQPLVVNLGQLWAAPLCARLLGRAGATVVDVESADRPDGSRLGTPRFYDVLHAGHQRMSLDFSSPNGRAALAELLREADVVLEASRPRALRSLGVPAETILADGRARVWVRITGHGQRHNRIAFGDDAAVTGGLVGWDQDGPVFAGDAIADPLTGLVSAVAAIGCLGRGDAWIVDVAMSEVVAYCVRPAVSARRCRSPRQGRPGGR